MGPSRVSNQIALPTSSIIDDENDNMTPQKMTQPDKGPRTKRLLSRPRDNRANINNNRVKDASNLLPGSISQSPLVSTNPKPKRNGTEFSTHASGSGFDGFRAQDRDDLGGNTNIGLGSYTGGDNTRPSHPSQSSHPENKGVPSRYYSKPPRAQAPLSSRQTEGRAPSQYPDRTTAPNTAPLNAKPTTTDRYYSTPSGMPHHGPSAGAPHRQNIPIKQPLQPTQQPPSSQPQPQSQPTQQRQLFHPQSTPRQNQYPPQPNSQLQSQRQPQPPLRSSSIPGGISNQPGPGLTTTAPSAASSQPRPLFDHHLPSSTAPGGAPGGQMPAYAMGSARPHYPPSSNATKPDDEPKFREMPKTAPYAASDPHRRDSLWNQHDHVEMYNHGRNSNNNGNGSRKVYPTQFPGLFWYFVRDIVMWKNFMTSAAVFMIGLSCLVLSMMLEIPLFAVVTIAVFIHMIFSVIITIFRFIYYRIIRASPKAFEESQNDIMSSSVIFQPEGIESFASAFARSLNHAIFTYQRATILRPISFTIFAFFICGFVLFLSFTMDLTTAGLIVFTGLFTIPKGLNLLLMSSRSHSRAVPDRQREIRRRKY
eukprot:gb/GECH01013796.1/.p1 GENE.gb/GECH01013796.1/~~gb/GECH01013796.1/.p1  ORF type:complete len:591 (+),score=91.19 gb/GECH01013796.1/:1-1773(+)